MRNPTFIFLALFPLTFAYPYPYPVDSHANAVGNANAQYGNAESQGRTFTDPFGNSNGDANSMASGSYPSANSIANSDTGRIFKRETTNGTSMDVDVIDRVRRQDSDTDTDDEDSDRVRRQDPDAVNTDDDDSDRVRRQDPDTGNTDEEQIVRVSRQDSDTESTDDEDSDRVRRQDPDAVNTDDQSDDKAGSDVYVVRKRRGYDEGPHGYGYGRHASGSAIGTANAAEGRSSSQGHTYTGGGVSRSDANGFSEGIHPSSTSIANSESDRRRRDAYPYPVPYAPGMSYANANGNAQAAEGRSISNGQTFTAGGNSAANSDGFSVGVHPATNAVANSDSRYRRDTTNSQSAPASANQSLIAPAAGIAIGDTGNVLTARGLTPDGKTFLVQSDSSSSGSGALSSSFSSTHS